MDIAVKELRHFPETNKAPGETCWKLEQGWFWIGKAARAGSGNLLPRGQALGGQTGVGNELQNCLTGNEYGIIDSENHFTIPLRYRGSPLRDYSTPSRIEVRK